MFPTHHVDTVNLPLRRTDFGIQFRGLTNVESHQVFASCNRAVLQSVLRGPYLNLVLQLRGVM